MNDTDLLQKIMIMLQRKYSHMIQLLTYTEDISKSFSQNDLPTVEMLLDMRYKIMLEIDSCDEEIKFFLNQLSDMARIRVMCQMSESPLISAVSFEESKINSIYIMINNILKKIVKSDNIINSQLAAGLKLAAIDSV